MKGLTMALPGLALVGGIIIGGVFGNPFDRAATAAPPDKETEMREAELTIVGGGGNVSIYNGSLYPQIELPVDSSRYPSGTTFTLQARVRSSSAGGGCLWLADVTDATPGPGPYFGVEVDDSRTCFSGAGVFSTVESTFSLPTGRHLYTIETQDLGGSGGHWLHTARLLAQWPTGKGRPK